MSNLPKVMYAKCDQCPLVEQPLVPSQQLTGTAIAIVGEAPGHTEVRMGQPFVGPSGKLLHKTLQVCKLSDMVGLITNVVLCYSAGAPPLQAIEACRARLQHELLQAGCQTTLLLGNTALTLLEQPGTITAVRGRHFVQGGLTYVPTFHPAAILRRPEMFGSFAEDIANVLTPAPPVPELVYAVVEAAEVEEVCAALLQKELLACDIETSGYHADRDRVLCVSFSWDGEHAVVIPEELTTHKAVAQLLQRHPKLLFHNGKFDALFLWVATGIRPRIAEDSLLLHYALDERRGTHGLKQLAGTLLGVPDWEADILRYLKRKSDSFALIPTDALYHYAAQDAAFTVLVFRQLQLRVAHDPEAQLLYPRLVRYANALLRIERLGMPVDVKAARALTQRLAEVALQQRAVMDQYAPGINPNSSQQVGRVLWDTLGFAPIKGRSTAAEILTELSHRYGEHPFLAALREYRVVTKLNSTYVRNIIDLASAQSTLRPSFQLHGTETGRLSTSRPNLLNIPRTTRNDYAPEIKRLFRAPRGWVFMSADYSQAEMRVLAVLSGDTNLIDQFRRGVDLHTEAARRLFGVNEPTKEQRMVAKMFNFGLVYGRTAFSIAKERGMPLAEAEQLLRQFFASMPQVKQWIEATHHTARTQGVLVTLQHRQRHFGLITPENEHELMNQASNFPIQSLSSDITLEALVQISERAQLHGKCYPLLMVHDSVVMLVREDSVAEVTQVVSTIMLHVPQQILGDSVPFKVDISVGSTWADC